MTSPMNNTFLGQLTTSLIPSLQPCIVCNCSNTTDTLSVTDQPAKVNGGFIAMAAGLSVIVPLICVLIIQLRRSKREERERAARAASSAESGLPPGQDCPPSYEQLFGSTVNPAHDGVPAQSRRNSLDTLIDGGEVRRLADAEVTLRNGQLSRTTESSVPAHRSIDGSFINQGYSSTSISTISGSEVFFHPLTHRLSPRNNLEAPGQAGSSIELNQISADFVDSSVVNPSDSVVIDMSSSEGSLSSGVTSASSRQTSMTSSSSSSFSSSGHSSLTDSGGSGGTGSESPPPPYSSPAPQRNNRGHPPPPPAQPSLHEMFRRLPGMHVSIQDILSSLLPPQEPTEGPPPSYEEALKILECAKQSVQHILTK